MRIPRCIRLSLTVTSFKLITFVDASTSAFGAVVYARFEHEQSCPPTCRLLASKSKVARSSRRRSGTRISGLHCLQPPKSLATSSTITQSGMVEMAKRIPSNVKQRPKWTEIVKNMKEGDVVVALENNLPRGRWPLGRIIETYPGKDGHTRVAKVQCGDRTLIRPIHKLVPLFQEN